MKKNILVFLVFSVFAVAFTSCNKEEVNKTTDEEQVTDEDVVTMEDLYQNTEDELEFQIEMRDENNDCPTVTVVPDDGSFPRTVTIDYGPDGCEGPNGRVRRGMIVVTQTNHMHIEGAVRTANLVDFYIDDVHLQGTKTWTNEGFDSQGNVTFTRTVENGSATFPNDAVATWQASHTMTQIAGGNTPFILLDNVFEITGSSSGVNRNGIPFSSEITTPLVKEKICPWIVSGIREVTVGQFTRTIDYGDGQCDRWATVTLPNGNTRTIPIRPWWR